MGGQQNRRCCVLVPCDCCCGWDDRNSVLAVVGVRHVNPTVPKNRYLWGLRMGSVSLDKIPLLNALILPPVLEHRSTRTRIIERHPGSSITMSASHFTNTNVVEYRIRLETIVLGSSF